VVKRWWQYKLKEEESKLNYKDKIQDIMSMRSSRRRFVDKIVSVSAILCVILAVIPLGSILIEVVRNGAPALSINFLTQTPGAIGSGLGGIGPAIEGSLIVVGLATAIGVPVGVLTGIYLSEYAANGIFPSSVRFFNDVLAGLPSIVIGIVGYVVLVLTIGSFSVWAGAFALSIIMIPIVVRVTEETLKIVPNSLREAGYSLGIPKRKVVSYIVLKSAKSGIITGIILAISRIAGETAPLIMTILGTDLFFTSLRGPVDALPLRIWRLASQPYQYAHDFGWGAALILILIVVGLSFGLRLISHKRGFKIRTITTG
jgi:phosphate transport system permease protein